ncbi:malate dehydrogenase [Quercus suber]|uniref:Malate dehydrogenase n=1 Tax=Quercus suber TaxID=58331 RepID=A0AAW0KY05_QUESU
MGDLSLMMGQIDYAIVPMIARGIMLGPDQPVELFSSLRFLNSCHEYGSIGVVATTDIVEVCKDVNIAVMLGGYPRKEIMLRKDMLSTNVSIYKV